MHITTDRAFVPASAPAVRHLHVVISVPSKPSGNPARSAASVALVLDRSGSMEGRKIQMAREAVALSIQLLKPDDHLGVVCYDDQITAVLDRTHATKEAKALASRRLEASMLEAPRTCMAARSVALNWRGTPRPTQWRR